MMNVSGSERSEALALSSLPRLDQQGFDWRALEPQPDERASPLISPTEWAEQRRRIRQLYMVDGLTRGKTRQVMKRRYGFNASDVQYKYQIKRWGFQKSLTHKDKKWIAEMRLFGQEDLGGEPTFLLCGNIIPKAKVSRQTRGISPSEGTDPFLLGNLVWYLPYESFSDAFRELRSVSTIKYSNPERLNICCVTCLECELDFYSPINFRLWDAPFDQHLVRKHAKFSHRFALMWCTSDPTLPNAPDHQIVHEWNYAREGKSENDEPEFYDHYPSFKQILMLLGSMSSTSVIQEEPQTKSLWLVDLSDDDKMKTLALITRWADKTPRDLIESFLTETSSQNDNQPPLSSANSPDTEMEMESVNPGTRPNPFDRYGINTPTYVSAMSLGSMFTL